MRKAQFSRIPRPGKELTQVLSKSARGREFRQIGNHVPGGRFRRRFPLSRSKQIRVPRSTKSKVDSPRIVDQCPQTCGRERRPDISGGPPLASIAGNQQGCMWHGRSQFSQFLRIRRPDDRPDAAESAVVGLFRQFFNDLSDVSVDCFSIGLAVLE